jgi:hypothetical protein
MASINPSNRRIKYVSISCANESCGREEEAEEKEEEEKEGGEDSGRREREGSGHNQIKQAQTDKRLCENTERHMQVYNSLAHLENPHIQSTTLCSHGRQCTHSPSFTLLMAIKKYGR